MRNKLNQPNIDNSDTINFPNGRIKNNDGSGNGTPVNEQTKGDLHEMIDKAMRLYGIVHNDLPDSEANGYQTIEALRALASKNDFVLDITSTAGVLNVPVKLAKMLDNEQIVCKATITKTTETQIKGSDNSQFVVTFIGAFLANEYVRLIKTASGVILVRLVDLVNLDVAVSEYLYLKKASQAQENAGAVDTVATTPLSNLTAFIRRVNGADSATYLATALQDGVYPKEHFAIVDAIGNPIERNYGTFSGSDFNNDAIGTNYAVTGNISSAQKTGNTPLGGILTVTLANAHDNLNIQALLSIQSLGDIEFDNDYKPLNYSVVSTTQIRVYLEETNPTVKNVKIHVQTNQR